MYVYVVNINLENLYIPLIQGSITISANLNVKLDRTSTPCAISHSKYIQITHRFT